MKTLAIRLEDAQHAQLSVIAQLDGTTVTDFIRSAIDAHLEAKRSQPELAAKAEQVLADIDAEAENRRSAIATLFDSTGDDDKDDEAKPAKPAGRSRKAAPAGG